MYSLLINEDKKIFTCFDGTKSIPLSKLNDNYCDCGDCSDEPGTPMGPQNETFYCKNFGFIPTEIPRWSIGDGICDCCDGSDETLNPHVKCPNTCGQFEKERLKIIRRFERPIKTGKNEMTKLISEGEKSKRKCINQIKTLKSALQGKPLFQNSNFTDQTSAALGGPISADIPTDNSINIPLDISSSDPAQNATLFTEEYRLQWAQQFCNISSTENLNESAIAKCESQIAADITSLNDELRMYNEITDNASAAFIPMINKEFSQGIYKLVFMNNLKQSTILVGTFTKFENFAMLFDGGDYCDVVKANRTGQVKLVCWNENKLLEFREPRTCYYESVFATPAACGEENIKRMKMLGKDELESLEKKLKGK